MNRYYQEEVLEWTEDDKIEIQDLYGNRHQKWSKEFEINNCDDT